jgi:hypothetical protein
MIRNPAVFTIERPQMQPEWVPFCQLESSVAASAALLAGFPRESAFPAKIDALSRLEPT